MFPFEDGWEIRRWDRVVERSGGVKEAFADLVRQSDTCNNSSTARFVDTCLSNKTTSRRRSRWWDGRDRLVVEAEGEELSIDILENERRGRWTSCKYSGWVTEYAMCTFSKEQSTWPCLCLSSA
jgi:hypothetical protein